MKPITKQQLVVVTIVALALVEPLTHLWIQYFPGEGYAPSGIHTGDSGHHLVAMRAFATDFHSPYATCLNADGPAAFHYFATPFFLMYAVLGAAGNVFTANMFLWLGILNGLGGALMLVAAYVLLRAIIPNHAENAFFLYALSGGLGGVLYLYARFSGWHDAPGFEDQFYRFAVYDLIEGQHRSPLLLFPRLYYTLPLALAYAALTCVLRHEERAAPRALGIAVILLACATFINLRIGPMALLVALVFLAFESRRPARRRVHIACALLLPVFAGSVAALWVSKDNAVYLANVDGIGDQVTWLLPLLYATLFLWPGIAVASVTAMRRTSGLDRLILTGLIAYLMALTALIFAYHGYYGNLLRGGDTNAAVAQSGNAVALALPAMVLLWRWRRPSQNFTVVPVWLVVWGLGFLAMTLSAWGDGWWMSTTPQRFLVFAALPMAALAALGFDAMCPALRRAGYAAALGCGGISLAAGALCFQGPLGHTPGQPPFGWLHYEWITASDAALMAGIPAGATVAVPPWSPFAYSEVLAQIPEIHVFSGPGAMNLGGASFAPLMADLAAFWDPATPGSRRRSIAITYCIDYVYVPSTTPPATGITNALATADWLEQSARNEDAILYRRTN